MSSKTNTRVGTSAKTPNKRTPRTLKVDENKSNLPTIISEPFNLKNIDIIGKVDDMRALTKELSIMARQLEQWLGIIYTVSMAFKDNGVLKDLLGAISSVGLRDYNDYRGSNQRKINNNPGPPPFPFPFFGNRENDKIDEEREEPNTNQNPAEGINFLEIINNPAFKEIMSKLFLQQKK